MKKLFALALLTLTALAHAAVGDLRDIKLGNGATQYQLTVPFPAPGTKCLRFMDGADGALLNTTIGCFDMGAGFTVTGNTLDVSAVPGPAGADGAQGVAGPAGATGATGPQGPPAPMINRLRTQTAADGTFVWTLGSPCFASNLPIASLVVEASGTDVYTSKITSISPTTVSVALTRTQVTSLLGVNLLSTTATVGATYIHLTAFCY